MVQKTFNNITEYQARHLIAVMEVNNDGALRGALEKITVSGEYTGNDSVKVIFNVPSNFNAQIFDNELTAIGNKKSIFDPAYSRTNLNRFPTLQEYDIVSS